MNQQEIIQIHSENAQWRGLYCITNNKHQGFRKKEAWMKKRMKEGLRLKILQSGKEPLAFIEYIPGSNAWRAVHAKEYMFIHCIWAKEKKNRNRGFMSQLILDCIEDAQKSNLAGVAVITGDGPWIADAGIFFKNGFRLVDTAPNGFQLLAYSFDNFPTPYFPQNWNVRKVQHPGLHLYYADQCPYVSKSINELKKTASEKGFNLGITKFTTPEEVQEFAPSPYGIFGLVYEGKLLADHFISKSHFINILTKEVTSSAVE